ncbi:hypothetical protein GUJ93_ZPchr0009g369 [Zizania palustris]|uniref:Uncharacterized protein n=1 Tax=Zizania palustris TaxID=103762 RepID=A0A8J5VLC6_ZIZPA|nr:hypothetical protein GUJ93_ZPchr0009g369 [Zizania palustris]
MEETKVEKKGGDVLAIAAKAPKQHTIAPASVVVEYVPPLMALVVKDHTSTSLGSEFNTTTDSDDVDVVANGKDKLPSLLVTTSFPLGKICTAWPCHAG